MFLHAKEAYKILDELSQSFNAAKKDLVNKGTKA
jgi:hypothetical protein